VADIIAGLRGASKRYGAVHALTDVSLGFRAGEVHALLGENGSGKSTAVRLMSGVIQPTNGTVTLAENPVTFSSPHDAMQRGVVTIFQQSQTVPDLTVAENILLGHEPRRFGILTRGQNAQAREILASLKTDIRLDQKVRSLSVAGQQVVAIAKALSVRARLLILDEPTASLGHAEASQLFDRVVRLRESGMAIVYITHRMAEVELLADVVTVLKDGRRMATRPASELSTEATIKLMVGRDLDQLFPERPEVRDRIVLQAVGLRSRDEKTVLEDFELRDGEIVGFAGLEGSGRATIARMLGGAERPSAGSLVVLGRPLTRPGVRKALAAGLAFVPPDRLHEGIVPAFSVQASTSQSALRLLSRFSVINSRAERRDARAQTTRLRIKVGDLDDNILTLSGGNQQKVLLARTLSARAKVLVMDEPTAGVDVGARGEIYAHLCSLTRDGMGVVVSSSDMVELIGICHRILVVREGRVVAEFSSAEATEERLMAAQLPDASSLEPTDQQEVAL